jgi:hypothetical protein
LSTTYLTAMSVEKGRGGFYFREKSFVERGEEKRA